ncbi:MAG: sulfatase-like hydrolase/transferase [Deltaproteobacteria bacterium]|nr:sulfatase-like hydrolase/transferase [Deltaproteobacteria bacterium]
MIIKSRYGIILIYCLISIVFFALLRAGLYVRSWHVIDHSLRHTLIIFGTGLVYDGIFALYLGLFFAALLFVIPNRVLNSRVFRYISYLFFFGFLCFLYFDLAAEWLFWDEFKTRFNFITVDYLVYRREITENMVQSYPLPYIFSGIFLAALATFYMVKGLLRQSLLSREGLLRRGVVTLSVLVVSFFSYHAVGQSFRDSFINNYERELCSNGPYQFVGAFRNNNLDYKPFYAYGQDLQISGLTKKSVRKDPEIGGLYDISRNVQPKRVEKRLNVLLISVESLSAEFLTRFGEKSDITPFMDQWFKNGLFFTRFYATGTRTTRALESITLSIPPTPGRSLVKRPDNGRLYSLGKVFKDHGYDVAFLYGGRGYFDNMNAFFSGNGYRIIDKYDFEDEEITFENAWGVCDGDLYRKAVGEANRAYQEGKPFFYHLMTTSNHRPYTYPEGKIDIPSGTGRHGAVKYADRALEEFLSLARKQKWFDDTVFVLVADHCASSNGEVGLPLNKYHIPLLIYSPKHIPAKEILKISSQIDIGPTLLSLLGFHYKSYFWGNDILDEHFHERALIGNYQKLGLYEDHKLVILSPGQKIDLMENPEQENRIKTLKADNPFSLTAISYYQGADFVLKHRMNRWH